MKSRRIPLALTLTLSLVVHVCIAVAMAYVALTAQNQTPRDTIDVSFFILTPPKAQPRELITPAPFVAPTPVPDLQVARQTEPTTRRAAIARQTTTSLNTALPASPVIADRPAAPKRGQVNVSSTPSVRPDTAQPLTTAADLTITSDAPLAAGLSSGNAHTAGLSGGDGTGEDAGTGRGAFGSAGGVNQGRGRVHSGLDSLVGGAGVANMNAALADVTENIVLGNNVPPLPEGTPGAIIQGRGKEILGRLNLVRLDDPLHPNLDI